MEKLIVLGTGHAGVTQCYNTCFALTNGQNSFLVDAGGGNSILGILKQVQIPLTSIHHAFVSHRHSDHILGMVWIIRIIASLMKAGRYEGTLTIYCHDELLHTLSALADLTLEKGITDLIGVRIILQPVADGQTVHIADYAFTFFDIHSIKAKQFGFKVTLKSGKLLSFLGDEPYHPSCQKYVENSDWLLCEAFCLHRDRDLFKPYEKHHSTVKDACELAAKLRVKNLVLWHTEDSDLPHRQKLYTAEGKNFYRGNLYVPNDLDILTL